MLLSNSFKCSAVALTSAGSYVKVGNAQIGQMLMFGHTRASSKAVPLVTQVLEILRKSRISSGKKRSSGASLPLPSQPPVQVAVRAGAPRGLAAAGLKVRPCHTVCLSLRRSSGAQYFLGIQLA